MAISRKISQKLSNLFFGPNKVSESGNTAVTSGLNNPSSPVMNAPASVRPHILTDDSSEAVEIRLLIEKFCNGQNLVNKEGFRMTMIQVAKAVSNLMEACTTGYDLALSTLDNHIMSKDEKVSKRALEFLYELYFLCNRHILQELMIDRRIPVKFTNNRHISKANQLLAAHMVIEWFERLYHPLLIHEFKRMVAGKDDELQQHSRSSKLSESFQESRAKVKEFKDLLSSLQPTDNINEHHRISHLKRKCERLQTKIHTLLESTIGRPSTSNKHDSEIFQSFAQLLDEIEDSFRLYNNISSSSLLLIPASTHTLRREGSLETVVNG